MKKLLKIFLVLTLLVFVQVSCNTTDPKLEPELLLKLEDVSCTEAWLQLSTNNIQLPTTINLLKNNSVTQTFSLSTQDSLLYIDSLLPNQNYSFQVSSIQHQVSSIKQQITTMDTTSHNFTFQNWTFGTIGSSVLFDVAIIDENNIWAVGKIMIADTSINGYTVYNALHWDGSNWEFRRIPYYFNGQAYYNPILAIFAFKENDIWFCGNGVINWDGANFRSIGVPSWGTYQMNKIWGENRNNLYIVGNNGSIAHYNGANWQRIESGTTLNINDIWGDYNEKTQEWEILAVASNIYGSFDKEVLQIKNASIEIINKDGIDEPLSSVWFKTNKKYYVIGSGTYEKKFLSDSIWKGDPLDITNYFENRIRANDINDLLVTGAFGEVLHFNGIFWKSFINETFLSNGTFLSGDIKNNLIVVVGYQSAQAVIMVGQR